MTSSITHLGTTSQGLNAIMNSAPFIAKLKTDVRLEMGSGSPTFTRATTAYVTDFEGLAKNCKSGEVRFTGARRVENLVNKSEDGTTWIKTAATITNGIADPFGGISAMTITATNTNGEVYSPPSATQLVGSFMVGRCWVRRRTGTGNVTYYFDQHQSVNITAKLSSSWILLSYSGSAGGSYTTGCDFILATSGDAIDICFPQCENLTGQANQNPSEYVSVGVLSSPFHGAMVDGVKYFPYQNGNTVISNVVTEAQGAAIADATLKGYLAEPAATQLVTPTASIRDMTDGSWAKVTMTTAKTATGIDGVANSASTITAAGANSTILQTLTAAASSRTYSAYVKRRTGTGTILMKQGATTLDITALINSSTYTLVQLNASVLNVAFGFQINTSGDALDVDFNQFEAGTAATSPMATAGAARNADVLTYQAANNLAALSDYSIYFEVQLSGSASLISGNNRLCIGSDLLYRPYLALGVEANKFDGFSNTTGAGAEVVSLTDSQKLLPNKIGFSKNATTVKAFANGVAGAGSAIGTQGAEISTIQIGCANSAGQLIGNIRNVRIWQTQLSNDVLQAITT